LTIIELSKTVFSSIKNEDLADDKMNIIKIDKNISNEDQNSKKKREDIKNKDVNSIEDLEKPFKNLKDNNHDYHHNRNHDIIDYYNPNYININNNFNNEIEDNFDSSENNVNLGTKNEDNFDNFFFIPKNSIIDSTQKSLFGIGEDISKNTKNIEEELNEGIITF